MIHNIGQLMVAGLLLALALVLAVSRRSAAGVRFAVLLALPVVLAFVGAVITARPFSPRYTLLGLVGALALLSVTIMEQRGSRRAVLIALFCGVSLWADAQWFWVSRYWKEDSRGAASRLAAALPPGARVAVAPAYVRATLAYYTRQTRSGLCVVGVEPAETFGEGDAPQALVLSRLHHLPRWRELQTAFERRAGAQLLTDSLGGYRVLVRDGTPAGSRVVSAVSAC